MRMKVIDVFSFILFVISVGAMDSDSMILPAVCCVCSVSYLLWRSNKLKGENL